MLVGRLSSLLIRIQISMGSLLSYLSSRGHIGNAKVADVLRHSHSGQMVEKYGFSLGYRTRNHHRFLLLVDCSDGH